MVHADFAEDIEAHNKWMPLHRTWLTPTVVALAKSIRQARQYDRLPILADALEEAGCTNAEVLLECRKPKPSHKDRRVINQILGKK